MQCDRANVRGLDQPRELPLADVVRLERQAQRCLAAVEVSPLSREDEPEVVIRDPVFHLQLGPRLLVRLQQRHRVGPDVDGPRPSILGWPENRLRAILDELPDDRDGSLVQINIAPLEPAQFVLAGSRVERQGVERRRLWAGGFGGCETLVNGKPQAKANHDQRRLAAWDVNEAPERMA